MKGVIFVLGFFLLASCGGGDESGASSGYGATDAGRELAWNDMGQNAIRAKLKDPDSAQFKNVTFFDGSGKPITCGEVNSKNGFGGYGGFERFIAAGDVITVMESEMAKGEMDKTWAQFCK
jgi:hypothetical protein